MNNVKVDNNGKFSAIMDSMVTCRPEKGFGEFTWNLEPGIIFAMEPGMP